MTTAQLSKQDYLKKYLSDGDKKKKKKKKVTQNSIIKSKIIDDDIDLKNMKAIDSDELEIFDLAEEAPQIVGIVDERPEEVRLMSEYRGSKKWKIVADEFGIEEVKVTAIGDEKANDAVKQNEKASGSRKVDGTELRQEGGSSGLRKAESEISKKGRDNSDASPPRKIKIEKPDSDASPPRKSKKNYDSDASPPRKSSKHYDSDASPPRKQRRKKQSPPVKVKKEKSDSDASPPRRNKKRNSDIIPPKLIKKEKSDSDASPPRRSGNNYDTDESPPRRIKKEKWDTNRKRRDSNGSPRRKGRRNKSDSDTSPPRSSRKQKDKGSTSGRRENRKGSRSPDDKSNRKESAKGSSKSNDSGSRSKARDEGTSREESKLKNTLGGKKSGLQNAEELRKEIEELKEREKEMKAAASGKNEAVVVRDRKTGKRIDPKEEARKKREKEEKEAEKIAQYAVWGKGVKQVQDSQDKLKDDLYEMSKPLARYADDKDLDDMLRNKEWDGDPMLEYMRKKKKKEREEAGGGRPQYEGAYMPNRYGIRPGHRWDGVDRSNGYEKKWFEEQNAKKAREEEAFKWSTADM